MAELTSSLTRIDAQLAINIDGSGGSLSNASVIFEKTIVYVGPQSDVPPQLQSRVNRTITAETVMPGMWDCHVHVLGVLDTRLEDYTKIPFGTKIARGIKCLELALESGFTSVREVAGYGIDLVEAERENSIISPTIYPCGAILSPTGGHADFHCIPFQLLKSMETDSQAFHLTCDGVGDCWKAVRLQLRKNAQVYSLLYFVYIFFYFIFSFYFILFYFFNFM
jgi:imidazolonepropionase-like amidohydrolase